MMKQIVITGLMALIATTVGCGQGMHAAGETPSAAFDGSSTPQSNLLADQAKLNGVLNQLGISNTASSGTGTSGTSTPSATPSPIPFPSGTPSTSPFMNCQFPMPTSTVQSELQTIMQDIQGQDTTSLSSDWQQYQSDLTTYINQLLSTLASCDPNSGLPTSLPSPLPTANSSTTTTGP